MLTLGTTTLSWYKPALPSFAVGAEIHAGDLVSVPILDAEMVVEAQMIRHARGWLSPAVAALIEVVKPEMAMSTAA